MNIIKFKKWSSQNWTSQTGVLGASAPFPSWRHNKLLMNVINIQIFASGCLCPLTQVLDLPLVFYAYGIAELAAAVEMGQWDCILDSMPIYLEHTWYM